MTVPALGPYWQRCAPSGVPDFANMRRGYTSEFDNAGFDIDLAWQRHRDWVLPEYEYLLDDPLIGNPPTKVMEGRTVSFGSIEYAAMASIILPHLAPVAWPYILEIGAGYGGLAYALMRARNDARYTIVDIHSVLECSRYYLARAGYLHRTKCLWPSEWSGVVGQDLYIQTRGFMEMSPEEVSWYFTNIQGDARVGSLFFCINKCNKGQQDSRCQSRWVDYGWDDKWSVLIADHWQERYPMPMVLLRREKESQPGVVETIRSLCG